MVLILRGLLLIKTCASLNLKYKSVDFHERTGDLRNYSSQVLDNVTTLCDILENGIGCWNVVYIVLLTEEKPFLKAEGNWKYEIMFINRDDLFSNSYGEYIICQTLCWAS